MASGFFAILDDIAALMDDVASVSKTATKNTMGILADDLAVNAEKASGFLAKRELPVLWKLMKGSFLNKIIILPIVFLLSAFLPIAIVPILLIGGLYLSFEGALKVYEFLVHHKTKNEKTTPLALSVEELEVYEDKKVKSALLVDFILSIEIVIIALGAVMDAPLSVQIPAVSIVAVIATLGVYGLVALLVRIDDTGAKLIELNKNKFTNMLGHFLVRSLPVIIRILNLVGTLAMLLVGGGIFVHNIHEIHEYVHALPAILGEFIVGIVVGVIALLLFLLGTSLIKVIKSK